MAMLADPVQHGDVVCPEAVTVAKPSQRTTVLGHFRSLYEELGPRGEQWQEMPAGGGDLRAQLILRPASRLSSARLRQVWGSWCTWRRWAAEQSGVSWPRPSPMQ